MHPREAVARRSQRRVEVARLELRGGAGERLAEVADGHVGLGGVARRAELRHRRVGLAEPREALLDLLPTGARVALHRVEIVAREGALGVGQLHRARIEPLHRRALHRRPQRG